MDREKIKSTIINGEVSLGIEFGSTRIKAVLINQQHHVIAKGFHDWENQHVDKYWTYSLEAIHQGMQSCYQSLAQDVEAQYDTKITRLASLGISGMMHGYMVFDKAGKQLVPFRTWRCTTTEQAAKELTQALQFNIPLRWNIAHLYQAILDQEEHVSQIRELNTLAGYVHRILTGNSIVGVGEASGMFPIDSSTHDFDTVMLEKTQNMIYNKGVQLDLRHILPKVMVAGQQAGILSAEGAKALDPTGNLLPGVPLCPPEGDAGTGMVATNSVGKRTGNISAGTSIFSMIVLEKPLSKLHVEIDMVTTPCGSPVAMAHCNTCTSDIDAYVKLLGEAATLMGAKFSLPELYDQLYFKALEGDLDGGKLVSYNYLAGEPIIGIEEGRPLLVRMPDSNFTLANLMRNLLFSAIATLKLGMDILFEEGVVVDSILGHGGFYKTKEVGQRISAAALKTPIAVNDTASEGGAFGIAVLAAFLLRQNTTLEAYLKTDVFAQDNSTVIEASKEEIQAFENFIERYKAVMPLEGQAAKYLTF